MQRDPTSLAGNSSFAYGYEADNCMANGLLGVQCNHSVPVSPALAVPSGITSPHIRSPLDAFELQPSKVCPRNFIIFDHTDEKGCIMYHPALVNNLNPTNIDLLQCHGEMVSTSSCQDNGNLEERFGLCFACGLMDFLMDYVIMMNFIMDYVVMMDFCEL